MSRLVEVLGSMFVLGRITTPDMSANQTQAQVHPGVAHLYAFLAAVFTGAFHFDLTHVRAGFRHSILLQAASAAG
jgi:hypothetical protein